MIDPQRSLVGTCEVIIRGQQLLLLPEKVTYWQEQQALIISDLHMGKAGHFRKAGIPIPGKLHIEELFLLDALISELGAERLIFLGDLFHSHWNLEWPLFSDWLAHYESLRAHLVIGNHDILDTSVYQNSGLIVDDTLALGPFLFSHEKIDSASAYNISGHIHPAIKLRGRARQGISLPCFYFSQQYGYLPAFGRFTGASRVDIKKGDQIFAIAEHQVIAIPNN